MRQIITLETQEANQSSGGLVTIRCAFWFSVPIGKEVAIPAFVSAVKGVAAPTAQEATDLQDGKVVEEIHQFSVPKSQTNNQVKAFLAACYTDRKTYRDALPDRGSRYGISWDGTAWSA